MEVYNSESEQVDAVRNFFRENGKAIILGVVLGAGGLLGWRYWHNSQITSANDAALGFETVITALKAGDSNAETATASFISSNANNYGAMAALELAQHLVKKGDLATAQKQLEVAASQTKDTELLAMINLRIARIQFEQQQIEPALASLAKVKAPSWVAEAELIRGNILVSQGKLAEAKVAYNSGLSLNPSQFVESQIRIQLQDLGV